MLQLAGGIIVGTTDTTWVIWRRPIFCATNLILIIHNQTSLLYSHGQDFISMAFLFVLQLWKKNAHRRKGAFSHASTAATVAQQLESYRQEWCTRILSTFVVVKVSCFQRLDSFSLELLLARSVKRHGRWQQLRWYGCGFFVTCCSEKLHLCALCICAYVRELALSALDEPEWINGAARRRVNGENPSHFFLLLFGGKKRFHRIVLYQPRRLHENVLEERKEKEEEKKLLGNGIYALMLKQQVLTAAADHAI